MKNIILFIAVIFSSASFAQNSIDTIFKKNKEVLLVKIVEVGLEEVKYKPLVNPNDVLLVIEISLIDKIIYANGVVQKFTDPLNDKASYTDNHSNIIKFNFLSPLHDRVHVNFEHSIQPGLSYEVGANIIGIGKSNQLNAPVGVVFNGGIRMFRMPEMKSRSDRYSHLLNGSYFQPTISFGATNHKYLHYEGDPNGPFTNKYVEKKSTHNFFMFSLDFGKQFIFANRISFDISTGLGYGTYSNKEKDFENYLFYNEGEDAVSYNDPTRFGFLLFPNTPLCLNFQIKVGYLFK